MVKVDYELIKARDPGLYCQLLYEVARLFVEDGLNYNQIPEKIYTWARSHANEYYDDEGKENIDRQWASRHVREAIKGEFHFLLLGEFREDMLTRKIKQHIDNAQHITLKIAPNDKLLLKQVCFDLDRALVEEVRTVPDGEDIVIGISGGRTMLELGWTLQSLRGQLNWHKLVPDDDKKRLVVCSLTSSGTRDNIYALSDMVAANVAQELGAQVRGLLGPPSFKDKTAHDAFESEPEVQLHKDLVSRAKIILTSVGNVRDEASLTSYIFRAVDPSHLDKIRDEHEHLGDMLYQCYDGHTGKIVDPSFEIADRIFSVIKLLELHQKVEQRQIKCIVVAKGAEKGRHALRGVIMKRMASDIYMDLRCAEALGEVAERIR